MFGAGEAKRKITNTASKHSNSGNVLVVTGSSNRWSYIIDELKVSDAIDKVKVHMISSGEPEVNDAENAVKAAHDISADAVVAIGGGSVIDVAKACAGLVTQPQGTYTYLEVVGEGKPLDKPALPVIAIPTTAGTGSEATKNGVLESTEHKRKVSIRHPSMVPREAIVDPELTLSAPPDATAASGLDAITQCLESYLSKNASPMTDALAVEGMKRGARSLHTAVTDGANIDARADMCICSLHSGITLANAGLGAVHGMYSSLVVSERIDTAYNIRKLASSSPLCLAC